MNPTKNQFSSEPRSVEKQFPISKFGVLTGLVLALSIGGLAYTKSKPERNDWIFQGQIGDRNDDGVDDVLLVRQERVVNFESIKYLINEKRHDFKYTGKVKNIDIPSNFQIGYLDGNFLRSRGVNITNFVYSPDFEKHVKISSVLPYHTKKNFNQPNPAKPDGPFLNQ